MPRKTGRPHMCTPKVIQRVLEATNNHATSEVAAAWAGLATSTFYKYLAAGRDERERILAGGKPAKGKAPFVEFADAVEKGRGQSAMSALAVIKSASVESWQAAAWLLERTRPKEYARRFVPELPSEEGEIKVELKWQNAKEAEE